AIACGCPLVVADIAPNREFLDERSAWLVPPDQPEVIADVLVEVLADPVAAAARVRAARRILEEHSLQALTRKHEAVFAQVLGAARTRIESERAVPSHR